MKRRIIESRKILVVALGAAAGCSAAPSGDVPPVAVNTPAAQIAPAAPEPAAAAPVPTAAPAAPERKLSNDPALLALRSELAGQARGKVQDPDHFRPICDKDGYPLVGNLMRKTSKPDYQPSAFCADMRAQARR